jgi:hypothetical protein
VCFSFLYAIYCESRAELLQDKAAVSTSQFGENPLYEPLTERGKLRIVQGVADFVRVRLAIFKGE